MQETAPIVVVLFDGQLAVFLSRKEVQAYLGTSWRAPSLDLHYRSAIILTLGETRVMRARLPACLLFMQWGTHSL